MKRFILLLLFVVLSTNTFAQFRFGAKITLSSNDLFFSPDNSTHTLGMFSASGGIVANYVFTKVLSLQSELIFNTVGGNCSQNVVDHTNIYRIPVDSYRETKIRLQYLEVPLIAKFTIFSNQKVNFNILAGAFAGCRLSAKEKIGDQSFENVTSAYSPFNAGYTFGFGLSVMKQRLFFELRGNRGLVNINTTDGPKINTIQAGYTVGYYLFQGKKK